LGEWGRGLGEGADLILHQAYFADSKILLISMTGEEQFVVYSVTVQALLKICPACKNIQVGALH
jgi:hypothetical protein